MTDRLDRLKEEQKVLLATSALKASLQSAQRLVERDCHYPKVTLETIVAKIDSTTFLYHEHLTICLVKMKNGFFVLGKAAPADPRNYEKSVGETFAREDAIKQIWQLEGYLLCEMSQG